MLYKHSQCNLNKAPTTNAMLPELVYAYKFVFIERITPRQSSDGQPGCFFFNDGFSAYPVSRSRPTGPASSSA